MADANKESKMGFPYIYSDEAILCLLSLREVFRLTYRQTEGIGRSLGRIMDVEIPIPDYPSLQKRAAKLEFVLSVESVQGGRDITGLKIYGEGEWKTRKHGKSQRRRWRRIHIAIDPKTGEIAGELVTDGNYHDADRWIRCSTRSTSG